MTLAWRGFLKLAPDLSPDATVYLVPAPRGAVGGAVRPLVDENAMIFGIDEVSTVVDSQLSFAVLHRFTHGTGVGNDTQLPGVVSNGRGFAARGGRVHPATDVCAPSRRGAPPWAPTTATPQPAQAAPVDSPSGTCGAGDE